LGQEFIIKSQDLEDKITQLLPSQGGFAAGVDLSASTTIIPIVDLTESAEGSSFRQDLQTASSFSTTTVQGGGATGTQTVVNTTGYYRCVISYSIAGDGGANNVILQLNDGTTQKIVWMQQTQNGSAATGANLHDTVKLNVFLSAGKTLEILHSGGSDCRYSISTHQIADVNGNLTNPI
jgi:hypothetical protein